MFPESGRGLGHVSDVTPTIFGIRSTYLQKYLSWRFQIWYAALYGEWRAGAQIIFPESERGLDLCLEVVSGHLTGLRPAHPLLLLSDFPFIKPSDCRHIMLLWGSILSAILATAWLLISFDVGSRNFTVGQYGGTEQLWNDPSCPYSIPPYDSTGESLCGLTDSWSPIHVSQKKCTNFKTAKLEIVRIDFDEIRQKYSKVCRIDFACFGFHVGLLFINRTPEITRILT